MSLKTHNTLNVPLKTVKNKTYESALRKRTLTL